VEYRQAALVTCSPTTTCSAPTAPAFDATWSGPYLVVDNVSNASILQVDGNGVRLALQVATQRRGMVSMTPAVPQEIVVLPRNVVP
jgi:hypothetical protein